MVIQNSYSGKAKFWIKWLSHFEFFRDMWWFLWHQSVRSVQLIHVLIVEHGIVLWEKGKYLADWDPVWEHILGAVKERRQRELCLSWSSLKESQNENVQWALLEFTLKTLKSTKYEISEHSKLIWLAIINRPSSKTKRSSINRILSSLRFSLLPPDYTVH